MQSGGYGNSSWLAPRNGYQYGWRRYPKYNNGLHEYRGAAARFRRQVLPAYKTNKTLFVGNIPKIKSKEELMSEFGGRTEGLVDVVVYNSPDLGQKNRGFCFLNFESHNHATVAKHLLSKPGYRIWGCDLRLDWADPIHTVDPVVMSQVTNLFVRNLCSQVHVDTLYNIFRTYGPLQRIKRLKDYAFIHFLDRMDAMQAMDELQGFYLFGLPIEIAWARPPCGKIMQQLILRARERRLIAQENRRNAPIPRMQDPQSDDEDPSRPTPSRATTPAPAGPLIASPEEIPRLLFDSIVPRRLQRRRSPRNPIALQR